MGSLRLWILKVLGGNVVIDIPPQVQVLNSWLQREIEEKEKWQSLFLKAMGIEKSGNGASLQPPTFIPQKKTWKIMKDKLESTDREKYWREKANQVEAEVKVGDKSES